MNLDPSSRDGARNLLLVKLLGGLVVTGVVIGLVVGVLGTTVLRSMGLKDQPAPEPTPKEKVTEVLDGGKSDDKSESPSPDESDDNSEPTTEKKKQKPPSVLKASPNPASPGQEITLAGSFRNLQSGSLQVQRREGGTWTDFPVTASIDPDGSFSTYILTSRTGTAPFRLLDKGSGRSTPVVRITIE